MITGEEPIIGLFAVCLTAAFFTVIPVSSLGTYDPWLDYNDDGKIDLKDVYTMNKAYGTTGNPTKNVTIAKRASKLAFSVENQVILNGSGYFSPWISIDGYSKVTICICTTSSNNYYRLQTAHTGGVVLFIVDEQSNFGTFLVKTFDVPNEQIQIVFWNNEQAIRTLYFDVYVIP